MPNESTDQFFPGRSAPVAPRAQAAGADNAQPFELPWPFSDVAAGTIFGLSVLPIIDRKTDHVQEFVVSYLDEIMASGVEMHETNDAVTVFYNPQKVTSEQIDEADKAGKLLERFPPATQLSNQRN